MSSLNKRGWKEARVRTTDVIAWSAAAFRYGGAPHTPWCRQSLMAQIRAAIEQGRFEAFRSGFYAARS